MPSGNQPARLDFAHIYSRYADSIFRFCLSQLRDRAAAEDVAAEAFASAFAAFERTRIDEDGVQSWLFRIARNATIDHLRRSRTRFRLFAALRGEVPARSADVETIAAARHDLLVVLASIRRLRHRDQQIIGLRIAGCLTYAQIGAVMGIKENAARMAAQRAMEKLRTALEESRD